LDKLAFISEIDDYLLNSTNPPCLESTVKLAQSINYIGKLQDLCVARAWNLKEYEYCQDIEGEYNNKEHVFTVLCSAASYKSISKDHAKKIAKKQAAQLSLEQINLNQQTYMSRSNITHEIVDKCKLNMTTPTNIEVCDDFMLINLGSNQLLSSEKNCVQKLKKCNSLDELNMSALKIVTEFIYFQGYCS